MIEAQRTVRINGVQNIDNLPACRVNVCAIAEIMTCLSIAQSLTREYGAQHRDVFVLLIYRILTRTREARSMPPWVQPVSILISFFFCSAFSKSCSSSHHDIRGQKDANIKLLQSDKVLLKTPSCCVRFSLMELCVSKKGGTYTSNT